MNTRPILILLGLLIPTITFAQHPLPTKSVSIFKNGTAFVIRSGEVSPEDGKFRIGHEHLPPAMFGTVWLTSPDQNLGAVSTFIDTTEKTMMATDYFTSAKENLGKKATFILGKEDTITGVIRDARDQMIAVQGSEVWSLIPAKDIRRLQYHDRPELSFTRKEAERLMQVEFNEPKAKQTVDFMYLRQGISWYPQYRIDLLDNDKANLTFRAEIGNDAEDIVDSEVNFVVGIPNFQFSNMQDPLFYFAPMDRFNNSFAAGNANQGFLQARADVSQQFSNTISYASSQDDFAGLPAPVEVAGESQEDLFYYSINGVTLPRGGRAMYTIFSREIEVQHIYEAKLPANTAASSSYYDDAETRPEPVLHRLKMKNNSTQPFTTGAAMVFRSSEGTSRPISQDKINYTPAGGQTFLTMTNASDVEVRHKENETARQINAKRYKKNQYDLVTVSGEVTVKNHKTSEIRLDIRRTITGSLEKTNPEWLLSQRTNFNGTLNDITDVCWELELEAGQEMTIKYEYEIYVR